MKRSAESNSAAAKNREDEIHQILEILHKWGIHTLGQLAALDKEQLGARLGPEAVRMWERANGQSNRMLHTHLENFKSEHAITAVSLDAQPTKPPKQQFGLFETTLRNPNQLSETLARLTALLGVDRVGTPVLEETHRPDAFRIQPFAWNVSMRFAADTHSASLRAGLSASTEEKKEAPGVALRRFRPPTSATVFISENVAAHFQSKKISGKLVDQRGPYLASGNWWDEKIWSRSEWDLQLENNVLVRCHQSPPSLKLPPTLASARRAGVVGIEKWEVDGIYD